MKIPKDKRDKLWQNIENEVQRRGKSKDKKFVLKGRWKKFVRMQEGFRIFAVDGKWIRDNISIIFGHGGHGLVHEFIPLNEIWISTRHCRESKFSNCQCRNVKDRQKVSRNYFDSCVVHEITEFRLMKKGWHYWPAHQVALQKERDLGLLKDPFTEVE